MGNEWILVFFTLFAQASVGLVMVMQCFGGGEQAIRGRCLPWAIGLMAVALLIAFLHLGSPFGGYRALYHLGASWLSREVFGTSLYIGLLSAIFAFEWRYGGRAWTRLGSWIAALVGLVSLYCMANIYAYSSVAAWETFYTHLSFFTAALMLGCFLYAGLVSRLPPPSLLRGGSAAAVGAAAAGVYLVGSFVFVIDLAEGSPAAQQSLRLLSDAWPLAAVGQMFALAGLAAAILWGRQRKDQAPAAGGWIYSSLSLMTLAVLIGRYLFYSTGVLPMGQL